MSRRPKTRAIAIRRLWSGVLLSLLMTAAPVFGGTGAKIVVSEPDFNAGRVSQGTPIEHVFELANHGDAPLIIEEIRMPPDVTLSTAPRNIAPGRDGTIGFRLQTHGIAGLLERQIVLSVNDQDRPDVRLTLAAMVFPPIEISPRPAFFVVADRGHTAEQSVEVINHESAPVHMQLMEGGPADRFNLRLEELDPGRRFRLTLAMTGQGEAGRRADRLLLKTSSAATPIIGVAAYTFLRERVYTFPETVDFGTIAASAGDPAPIGSIQTLMVYQQGGSDFHATFSSDLPLDIRAERGPKGDRWQATIRVQNDASPPGRLTGAITVTTDDPEFPRLVVPVTAEIRRK